jgi:hypothetical protein
LSKPANLDLVPSAQASPEAVHRMPVIEWADILLQLALYMPSLKVVLVEVSLLCRNVEADSRAVRSTAAASMRLEAVLSSLSLLPRGTVFARPLGQCGLEPVE